MINRRSFRSTLSTSVLLSVRPRPTPPRCPGRSTLFTYDWTDSRSILEPKKLYRTHSPAAQCRREVVLGILVDRQPIAGAREHRAEELLGVRGLERVAVGAEVRGFLHLRL